MEEKYVENSPKLSEAKVFTGGSQSGIINTGRDIVGIDSIDKPIEQRNAARGNPNAILQFGVPLNSRQRFLLDSLNGYDARVTVLKKSVNMSDLSALTAYTGDEFAMFTKSNERLIVRGNSYSVNIGTADAMQLSLQGYKWSGHTHPGIELNCLLSSPGDKAILMLFKQEKSVIYNSKGQFDIFIKE